MCASVSLVMFGGSSVPPLSFPTDGDMLDFLVQTGDISKPDGLLATWFHRANSKEDMNHALAGTLTHIFTTDNMTFVFDGVV